MEIIHGPFTFLSISYTIRNSRTTWLSGGESIPLHTLLSFHYPRRRISYRYIQVHLCTFSKRSANRAILTLVSDWKLDPWRNKIFSWLSLLVLPLMLL